MVDVYLSVDDVEERINKSFTSTSSPTQTQLTSFITLAENDFEQMFGSHSLGDKTDIVEGYHFGIILPSFPVNSISSITYNSGDEFSPEWIYTLNTDEYYIENSTIGKVAIKNPRVGKRKYQVEYNSGYDYEDVPEIIKTIVLLLTMRYIFQETLYKSGHVSESEQIIDVDVYREITKGGNPINGFQDLDFLIELYKEQFKDKIKAYLY